jgi:hypothetical protein
MDPDDHAPAGAVVPQGMSRRELTGAVTRCTVLQRTLVSSKFARGNDFLMGYHNCRNSYDFCVSDTALSIAIMGAWILKEITEYGYYVDVYV